MNQSAKSTAEEIYLLFQESYTVEADLLGIANFPPLSRSVSNIRESKTHFWGYYKNSILAAVAEIELKPEICNRISIRPLTHFKSVALLCLCSHHSGAMLSNPNCLIYCDLKPHHEPYRIIRVKDRLLDIHSFVVSPIFFRQGIGSKLLCAIMDSEIWNRAVVETGSANKPAILLYQKFGFIEEKEWITGEGIEKIMLSQEK
ncbi:MAG: GNAT family N-acetyltransferase [Cyclobacteriaceae bacterium]|nr:GNAT family N-acetyltransferase [Cyclobacteriaceae bacterium]